MNARNAGKAPRKVAEPIARAIEELRRHESVRTVRDPLVTDKSVIVEGEFEVPLPSREQGAGVSVTGVRALEPVTFAFFPGYPFDAPAIWLRADFPRTFAHINPTRSSDLVLPCIADIPIGELLHEGLGFPRVLDEVARWLAGAAAGTLIDPAQGWQPMRRDFIAGLVSFATGPIVTAVTPRAGHVLRGAYMFGLGKSIHAKINTATSLDGVAKSLATYFARIDEGADSYSRTAAVIAWGDAKGRDGRPRFDDRYIPDTVENVESLLALANTFEVRAELSKGLEACARALLQMKVADRPSHIVAMLCARRPFKLIGSDFAIECLPYAVKVDMNGDAFSANATAEPLSHREDLSSDFLRRLSGGGTSQAPGPIVMLGAGSLGSKIAMHLARAGLGPFAIVDKGFLDPHHLARHAVSSTLDYRFAFKASDLSRMVKTFSSHSTPHFENIVDILTSEGSRADVLPKTAKLAIETTGSLAVREYLAQLPPRAVPRVAHAILYDSGNVGLLAVEGERRNPRVDDLVAHFYHRTLSDPDLAARMVSGDAAMTRIAVGHGCGSYSMVLPDAQLSIPAGGMGERLRRLIENPMPTTGLMLVGISTSDGLGYSWSETTLGKTEDFGAEDQSPWRVRLLRPVVVEMTEEAEKYGGKETGGGVVGHLSMLRRCITITGLIPAPPDSVRKHNEFIMGVEGIREEAVRIQSLSGGYITYLGTWHSHPLGGKPSAKDYRTFATISALREGVPGVVLVWTRRRFFAIAADRS